MKLQYIYLMLGIATLALNLAITVHLFKSHRNVSCRETSEGNDIITFKLTREHNSEGVTTAAVPYNDTMPLGD